MVLLTLTSHNVTSRMTPLLSIPTGNHYLPPLASLRSKRKATQRRLEAGAYQSRSLLWFSKKTVCKTHHKSSKDPYSYSKESIHSCQCICTVCTKIIQVQWNSSIIPH